MNQREHFEKAGLIEYYIHETESQLDESVKLLRKASWYCREVGTTYDDNRNSTINGEAFILLERIKELHNYWENRYAELEDDEEYFD